MLGKEICIFYKLEIKSKGQVGPIVLSQSLLDYNRGRVYY